jgi:hypothetical protein
MCIPLLRVLCAPRRRQIRRQYSQPHCRPSHCHLRKHITCGRLFNCLWLLQASVKIGVKNYNLDQSQYTVKNFSLHNCQTVHSAIKHCEKAKVRYPTVTNVISVHSTPRGSATVCSPQFVTLHGRWW